MKPVPVKCVDEHDLIRIDFGEFGVKVQDASEDCNGHPRDDNCRAVCTKPDDEKRGKSGFWQTVQDYQVRFQYFGKFSEEPENDRDKEAENDDQKETDQSFIKGNTDMAENTSIGRHFPETQSNPGRAAENERIDQSRICRKFPEKKKCQKDRDSGNGNDPLMSAVHIQVM